MKNPAAVSLGQLGGKAGKGKPKNRTPEQQARLCELAKAGKKAAAERRKQLKENNNGNL